MLKLNCVGTSAVCEDKINNISNFYLSIIHGCVQAQKTNLLVGNLERDLFSKFRAFLYMVVYDQDSQACMTGGCEQCPMTPAYM